jgi:hypothetical protein
VIVRAGQPIPKRWSLLRIELERILADGEWHSAGRLYGQTRCFVDPRIAARAWTHDYEAKAKLRGYTRPASQVFVEREEAALETGRRMTWADTISNMRLRGRIEVEGPPRARRVRLRAPAAPAAPAVELVIVRELADGARLSKVVQLAS